MALQNITPQYQAEEKTAQYHLRPVPIPNGLAQTGRMLTDAGQGLQKASFGLMLGLKQRNDKLQAEKDEYALQDAMTKLTTLSTKRATEFMNLGGSETDGITGKFENDFDGFVSQCGAGLNPRAYRQYMTRAQSLRLSLWGRVQGHETSNMRAANIQGAKTDIENLSATYALTHDPAILEQMQIAYDNLYAAQFGRLPESVRAGFGKRYNPETDKFDGPPKGFGWRGVQDAGNGKVMTEVSEDMDVDGKRVSYPLIVPDTTDEELEQIRRGDITPEIRKKARDWYFNRAEGGKSAFYDGAPDDEPLRNVTDDQRAMERSSKAYWQGWQNIVDGTAGKVFEEFAKDGNLDGMSQIYYDSEAIFGTEISDKAKVPMKQAMDQQIEYQETFYAAKTIFEGIKKSDPRSMGGEYFTEKQDQVFWNWINSLESSEDKKDNKKAQYIRSWYEDLKKTQQRNLGIAVAENTKGLFESDNLVNVGHDIMMLENIISAMPDNPVRDQLMILHDKYQAAYNKRDMEYAKAIADAQKLEQSQQAARIKAIEAEQKRKDDQQAALDKAWQNSDERKRAVARFKLGFYTNAGVVSFKDGPSFDLKTEDGQNNFLKFARYDGTNGWLFEEDIAYFREMFSGQIRNNARKDAASLIADVMNSTRKDNAWTYIKVNSMMPDLVDDVMRQIYTGDNPTPGSPLSAEQRDKNERIVKQYISERLLEAATIKERPSGWWSLVPWVGAPYFLFGSTDNETTLRDFMNGGIDKYGNIDEGRSQRAFGNLERTGDQKTLNERRRTDLEFGDIAHVGSKSDTAIWLMERKAAQNKAVEGAEE